MRARKSLPVSAPALAGAASSEATLLNLGCGPFARAGWINCDLKPVSGVELRADLRRGLPLANASVDGIAAIHVLQDLAYTELDAALRELRRVLVRGGVLRLGLPDLDRALRAYACGDGAYFHVPDGDAASLGAKLVTQIVWYGSVRTPFTWDFARERLAHAGFGQVRRCAFGHTRSAHAALAALDNRERETLFIEAVA
ncbi:MAG: class I SAM-dependent methyltransferase [Gammaproteobacteria bacterium]